MEHRSKSRPNARVREDTRHADVLETSAVCAAHEAHSLADELPLCAAIERDPPPSSLPLHLCRL